MPIPIEKLQALKHIVVHDKCPDGTVSAMILKWCLPDAKVEFIQYDTPEHEILEAKPGTIFADFSPWMPGLPEDPTDEDLRIREEAKKKLQTHVEAGAIVLDHHKTQRDVVAEFGELGVFGDEKTEPGVCGAVLAFREIALQLKPKPFLVVHGPNDHKIIEKVATLAGIRDTWQTQDPRWREACEQATALDFWPDAELLKLDPGQWGEKLELGPMLFQRRLDWAKRCGDNSFRFTSEAGTKVAVFEGVKAASDVAEHLHTEVDLIIGFDIFMQAGEPVMIFSTRSHTDFDCAAFCTAHKGGGHTRAAGFKHVLQPEDPNPFYLARKVLEEYEARDRGVAAG